LIKKRRSLGYAQGTVTKTNYLGGFQYQSVNGSAMVLQFFPTSEGYVKNTAGIFNYVFNYTDHLGNVRISYQDINNDGTIANSEILEENNYTPFGLKHKGYNSNNAQLEYKYKYNGKELQDENIGGQQLNLYDYGARNYDPALGRWMNIDPLAEEFPAWSPYNYTMNNPINLIDHDGRAPLPPNEYEIDLRTGKQTMISGLGGQDVSFYHYKGGGAEYNGKTRILNMNTYEEQWMSSSKYMLGYEHRDNTVNYETIFDEFITGTGPEKSLIGDQWHQMNKEIMKSSQFESAIESWKENGLDSKYYFEGTFGIPGAVKAGTNMTAQMLGKAGVSFYPIGDLVAIMVTDSKSKTSWSLNPFAKKEENNIPRVNGQGGPESTTHQTYIWTMPIDDLLKLDD